MKHTVFLEISGTKIPGNFSENSKKTTEFYENTANSRYFLVYLNIAGNFQQDCIRAKMPPDASYPPSEVFFLLQGRSVLIDGSSVSSWEDPSLDLTIRISPFCNFYYSQIFKRNAHSLECSLISCNLFSENRVVLEKLSSLISAHFRGVQENQLCSK